MDHHEEAPEAGATSSGGAYACGGAAGDEEMKMVRFELEAAEALAGLAHSSTKLQEEDHSDRDGYHSVIEEPPPIHNHFPLGAGATIVIQTEHQEQEQRQRRETVYLPVKLDEQDEHHQKLGGGKSRQPLTETEKEARRLRRVLANRESARQTIRRRQAMFEELTRKASHLELENENLKREKELASKEYDSLRTANTCLKEQVKQMATLEATEAAAGKIHKVVTQAAVRPPASAATISTPFFPYDQPSVLPLHWHSLMQSMLQYRPQSDSETSSLVPMTETWRPNSFVDQRNSNSIPNPNPNPGALLYVLPLPCFFPFHSSSNAAALPQPSCPIERQIETHLSNQPSSILSPCSPSLPLMAYNRGDDHHHHRSEATQPNTTNLAPPPLSSVRPSSSSASGRLTVSSKQDASTEEAVVSVTQHAAIVSEENREQLAQYQKPRDASTAVEARKRRRELMKLKAIQPGQLL